MQEKNEKVLRIMAEKKCVDNGHSSNIDSLIEKLRFETRRESEDDLFKSRNLIIQSTNRRLERPNESNHDINNEITALENLIKRLQSEIVVMTESANKSEYGTDIFENKDGNSRETNKNILINEEQDKAPSCSDTNSPAILEVDNNRTEQVKIYAEVTNLNALWDDTKLSNNSNFELVEQPIQSVNNMKHIVSVNCAMLALETPLSIESSNITQIECSANVIEEHVEDASLNYENTVNENHDAMEISSQNELNRSSTENISNTAIDNISGNVNKDVDGSIKREAPIVLNAEIPNKLSSISQPMVIKESKSENQFGGGAIFKETTDITKTGTGKASKTESLKISENPLESNPEIPLEPAKDTHLTAKSKIGKKFECLLKKSETEEASKTTSLKISENVTAFNNTNIIEPNQEIPLASTNDTLEITQTVSREKKSEGLFKNINRTLRKMVGKDSEKSIPKENKKSVTSTSAKNDTQESGPASSISKNETRPDPKSKDDDDDKPKVVPIEYSQKSLEIIKTSNSENSISLTGTIESEKSNELNRTSETLNFDQEDKSFNPENLVNTDDLQEFKDTTSSSLTLNTENIFDISEISKDSDRELCSIKKSDQVLDSQDSISSAILASLSSNMSQSHSGIGNSLFNALTGVINTEDQRNESVMKVELLTEGNNSTEPSLLEQNSTLENNNEEDLSQEDDVDEEGDNNTYDVD